MLKSGYILSTDDQLLAVMHNKMPIQAWQDGDALHHGGQIESITEIAVKIDGQYFMRNACVFKIR
jgi:hypothetical protein